MASSNSLSLSLSAAAVKPLMADLMAESVRLHLHPTLAAP
jgi:hypothetical protein